MLGIAIASAVGKRTKEHIDLTGHDSLLWLLVAIMEELHGRAAAERWLLHSRTYKAEVLHSEPENGNFSTWSGNGWVPGAGNTLFTLSTILTIRFSPQLEAIPPAISREYRARCRAFVVWRAIGTLFCFTQTRLDNCNCN